MTIASELITILGFRVEGDANLARYKKQQREIERETESHAGRMTAINARFGMAAGAATTALIAGGVKAYKAAAKSEEFWGRAALNAGQNADVAFQWMKRGGEMALKFGVSNERVQEGFATLIAKGQSADEAWSFLPEIVKAAQAFNAETGTMADAAFSAQKAFGLRNDQIATSLSLMGASGQSGQFETQDIARQTPGLDLMYANSTKTTGLDAQKSFHSWLQVIREGAPSSSEAATWAQNFLQKMFSDAAIKSFAEDFGIDIKAAIAKEMTDKGIDFMPAYANILNRTLGGDTSRTSEIFGMDQQVSLGAAAMMNGAKNDRFSFFRNALEGTEAVETANKNLNQVLDMQSIKLQNLSTRWDSFWNNVGSKIANPVGFGLDTVSNQLDDPGDLEAGLRKRGYSGAGLFAKQFFMTPGEMKDIIAEERTIRAGGKIAPVAAGGDSMVKRSYTMPAKPTASVIPAGRDFTAESPTTPQSGGWKAVQDMIAGMDAHLAKMTGDAPVNAAITDSRTDNRNQSVNVTSSVVQNISQPSSAPGAVGAATNAAVSGAVQQAARIQQEPAQ